MTTHSRVKRVVIGGALIATISIVGAVYLHEARPEDSEKQDITSGLTLSLVERRDVEPLHERSDRISRVSASVRAFRPGDTFESLASRLDGVRASDPNARAMLIDAAERCEDFQLTPPRNDASDVSTRTYRKWKAHFCSHSRQFEAEKLRADGSYLDQASILRREDGAYVPGMTDEAVRIVLTSTSYADIQAAGDYLLYMRDADWNLGAEWVAGTPMQGRLKELQRVAVDSISCAYSGACEADGLQTMVACAMRRACAPGVSLYEIWERSFNSDELRVIQRMQESLTEQRKVLPGSGMSVSTLRMPAP